MSDESQLSPLKRAFLAVQALQGKVQELELAKTEPIAVVGLACRFPGAPNEARYWDLLRDGVDAIVERPTNRWTTDDVPDPESELATRWGGFLPSVDQFDPQFFGIAPREATGMDPQQRLFLEVCWEALENAGIAPDRLKGSKTGVYVGACTTDYASMQTRGGDLAELGTHYASGIAHSIIPGRVSYMLGLNGPSVSIDTACSSSLVSVHLACQALRTGDCDMALAGGVNVVLLPDNAIAFGRTGMMAVDGRCKPFDAAADGFVRGEGSGVVVLKRLSKALADGDIIHALIRGSAVNQDGASSGMTAPSGPSQEAVIRTALHAANLAPKDVEYIEAHGTGTVLGDPIEAQAIGAALGEGRSPDQKVLVGSVKSNVGHLEASAGIAGLIKVVLSLRHGAIPASLHFKNPNPLIAWDSLPVDVPAKLTEWRAPKGQRIAGVSSFGFGGTNAHVIVSEAPSSNASASDDAPVERTRHLIALSAPTETGLRSVAASIAAHIDAHPEQAIADVAHTTNTGRATQGYRAALPIGSNTDVSGALRAFAGGEPTTVVSGPRVSDAPRIVFLFSGQGSQYADMGRRLYETQPTYKRAIDECDALLRGELQPGILEVLYPQSGTNDLLDQTLYTQPALFALEYALATLWLSWNVKPAALMGHSLGEFVAATVAGVMSLEDALRLVTARGQLSHKLPQTGAMAAVLTDIDSIRAVLAAQGNVVSIAAINAPQNGVISGPREALETALATFRSQGVDVRPLPISNAFHSPAIEPMLAEFEAAASRVTYSTQRIPIYSNLLGRRAAAGEMSNASYWTRHLREPVQFASGFASAIADGFTTFLEVGPHTVLLGLGRQCFPDNPGTWLPSLRRGYDDWTILLDAVGQLYVRGAPIDWKAFDRDYRRHRLALPTYPFERQRYWAAAGRPRKASAKRRRDDTHPLLGRRVASPFIDERIFESDLSQDTVAWLTDHRVLGTAVLPTTAYLELAWAAAVALHGDAVSAIETIDIFDALTIPDAGNTRMQIAVSPENGSSAAVRIASTSSDGADDNSVKWRSHASGTIVLNASRPAPVADLAAIRARCTQAIAPSRLHEALNARGIDLGPRFHGLSEVIRTDGEAIGRLSAPEVLENDLAGYRIHPALLDAALQVMTAALFREEELEGSRDTYMPVSVERYRILAAPARELWSHVVIRSAATTAPIADLRLYDDAGQLVAEIEGLRLRRVEAAAWANAPQKSGTDLYEITWEPVPADAVGQSSESWSTPTVATIEEKVSPSFQTLVTQHRLREYGTSAADLDAVSRDFIIDALNALGWIPQAGARIDEMQLRAQLGVAARYDRLFGRFLEILAEDGLLQRDESAWIVNRPLVSSRPVERLDAIRRAHPDAAAELGLVARTGPRLADVLAGRVDSLSLLFPGGQFQEADQLYRASPSAQVLNGLAVEAVRAVVAAAPSDVPLRVLEIGGGTGGTSSFVLPALPADRTRYVFTDLSPLFLARAEEGFRAHPFVEYKLLDIERNPAEQGMRGETFDLVIAANVLHATRDLGETLAHVRSLLRPGGTLILLEGTRPTRWIDVTFGLTDGWWRFADESLRPNYPLIDRPRWATALVRAGFEQPAALPAETGDSALDANVLIATRASTAVLARETWLVLADATGVGEAIAARLRESGREAAVAYVGGHFARNGAEFSIPVDDAVAYRRMIDEMTSAGATLSGVLHTWSLDSEIGDDASLADVHASLDRGCRSMLHLAQAMATCSAATGSRLVVVTRGAQTVGDSGDAASPIHATIWGLANTIRIEHPDLACACIDLDPAANALPDDLLARIVARGEPQLGFRDGTWRAARLARHADAGPSQSGDERLINTTPGVLDGLRFVPDDERSPGPGEIAIRVEQSAMNFRDVLIALNMYPGAAALDRLGGECAGEIVAVGAGVHDLHVGDAVAAMAPGGFGSLAITHAELAMRRPVPMTLEEAVTLPSAFATAWHALYDLAGLSRGETVLIHAGAGGVGLAAIQLAKRVGAVILATAGSPEKRAYLQSLGVDHVMDSRSSSYATEIGRVTRGRGVDVVLNSLADDHIRRSLSVVATGGRFVELGKRGIWTPEQVRAMRRTVRYFVVDLAAVGEERPEVIGDVLRKVARAAEAGEIHALPVTRFVSADIGAAYRYMAQTKHIGKIVIRRAPRARMATIRADGTYLITGGLGGLGLATAERLIERGAGHVVLMSRRSASPKTRAILDAWNATTSRVSVHVGDVARSGDVERALQHIRESLPPLRGIVHSAGSLHDGVLVGQTWEHFAGTFAAKIDGTWNLHRLTRDIPLDFFVLFSSISSIFGSPGQGNHAAANAFMDSFAHYRRARGERASSINWGAWSETGAAVAHDVSTRLDAQGMGSIATRDGVDLFEHLLESDPVQVAAMSADWTVFARKVAGGQMRSTLLANLATAIEAQQPVRPSAPAVAESRPATSSIRDAAPATRWNLLLQHMRGLAARVLGLEKDSLVDVNRPLQELGLDSLMAVELRNRMKSDLGLERAVSATIVFDHPTVQALTDYVGGTLFSWESREAPPRPVSMPQSGGFDLLDQLESLSSDEAEALLMNKMRGET